MFKAPCANYQNSPYNSFPHTADDRGDKLRLRDMSVTILKALMPVIHTHCQLKVWQTYHKEEEEGALTLGPSAKWEAQC